MDLFLDRGHSRSPPALRSTSLDAEHAGRGSHHSDRVKAPAALDPDSTQPFQPTVAAQPPNSFWPGPAVNLALLREPSPPSCLHGGAITARACGSPLLWAGAPACSGLIS
jgi:hypothetical protein